MMSSWLLKIFKQAIRCKRPENIIKDLTNWVVISWICGQDQIAQGEDSKLVQIAKSMWESQPTSPIRNPGEVNLKTDAQLAYDIQSGRSWTCWKDKENIFPMRPVSYRNKI
jgi:hypothetical protein